MLPVFRPGELALARPGPLRPGDCAVYSYRGRTLLHRVIKVSSDGAWLADDAGRLAPHLVPWADIKGRALGGPLSRGLAGRIYSSLRRRLSFLINA